MERKNGPEDRKKLTVEEAALAMGVSSVRAVARIEKEISQLEANGHIVDPEEHTRRVLTRVE
ncbi:TPA: hypothetical protein DIS56_01750 [Candidatus Saccharibacteria bacterium]|nr:MAG: hypothetical protein UX30_C0007G0056 [Candidatus Saccharibacteria bacterium GW2011_GWA2_46_10]OGL35552.1 MAG: hypothetical protein A3F05_00460 [Candidatus Saccharibacteria bacterium RIFCSPHIGHO2_12_FULL_47_17]HCM51834.1 hypothetical protein [Candidatus Saccharibacteria bacterium]